MRDDKRVIYKYPIQQGGETVIRGWFTRFMHVGEQNGELMVWMENSLTHSGKAGWAPRTPDEMIEVTFHAIGTGWTYENGELGFHMGTVQMSDGLVWHVYIGPGTRWIEP